MLELGDEEAIRFRQSASMEKAEGQLLVTNVRIHWSGNSGEGDAPDFQTPWPNIIKYQYCEPSNPKMKGKAGIKLFLASGKVESAMFMLLGTDRASQLEALKTVVRDCFSANTTAAASSSSSSVALPALGSTTLDSRRAAAPSSSSSSSSSSSAGSKRPRGQDILDRNSDEAQRKAQLLQRRQELLAADTTLAKFYKDLCGSGSGSSSGGGDGGGILTEEEFWEAHMPEYASQLSQRDADDYSQKGRLPLKSRIAAGGGGLKLTREDILQILEEDPVTRRAHADLVPHQKSEQEFWQLYINKFYHRTDRSSQADQLFARYDRKAAEQGQGQGQGRAATNQMTSSSSASGQAQGLDSKSSSHEVTAAAAVAGGYGRATGSSAQFDLLSSWADKTSTSVVERFDAEDSKYVAKESLAKIAEDSFRIVLPSKQQQHEQSLGSHSAQSSSHAAGAGLGAGAELREQRQDEEAIHALQGYSAPAYVRLNIAPTAFASGSAAAAAAAPESAPAKKGGGGFAKAAGTSSGGGGGGGGGGGFSKGGAGGIATVSRGVLRQSTGAVPTADALLRSLTQFVPTAESAAAYVINDRRTLKEMAHFFRVAAIDASARRERQKDYEAFGIPSEQDGISAGAGQADDVMVGNDSAMDDDAAMGAHAPGWELPSDFKTEMKEMHSSIAEYVRHFYAILGRDHDQPVPGSSGAGKIESILSRLELTSQKIIAKKQRYRTEMAGQASVVNAATKLTSATRGAAISHLLDELLKVLTRVKTVWGAFCKQFAAAAS